MAGNPVDLDYIDTALVKTAKGLWIAASRSSNKPSPLTPIGTRAMIPIANTISAASQCSASPGFRPNADATSTSVGGTKPIR